MADAQQLWNQSADAWIETVEEDKSRVLLLDPRVDSLLGDVSGLTILDIGCGEGRLCRRLAAKGALCTGVDPTEAFIEMAASRHPEGRYLQQFAEDLDFSNEFDWSVFYLSLIDISDFAEAIFRAQRALKPGGKIIAANLNSFATSLPEAWVKNDKGERLWMQVDNYMTPQAHRVAWKGIDVVNYHRPATHYFQAFLSAGLLLRHYEEAVPTREVLASHPEMELHVRGPYFNIQIWQKPNP